MAAQAQLAADPHGRLAQHIAARVPEEPPRRARIAPRNDSSPGNRARPGVAVLGTRARPAVDSGARPKVLLYSHDTYGLGHLRRNLVIAEHLLQRTPPFSVLLLTGSPVLKSWPLPAGLEVQSLPPVVKVGAEKYAPRDSDDSFAMVKGYREALILKTVVRYRPDVVLVDHAPAGMNGELLAALALVRREMPATRIVLGLRDILDDRDVVRALWREQEIYSLLENVYHQILVYGSGDLFDVVREYDLPGNVAAKVSYCGYVARAHDGASSSASPHLATTVPASGRPVILVTAGGGGDGYALMEAYLRALRHMPDGIAQSLIVSGPLMPVQQRQALEQAATQRPDVKIIPCATELTDVMRRADLVIAMGGYNTSAEILVAGKPAILVPRAAPRAEQRMRATLLAGLGLVWTVQPEDDLPARLAELIPSILAGARPARHKGGTVDLGGAYRVGAILEALVSIDAGARLGLA
ncbi:MAG: hypothetical protein KGJ12_02740 [Gammaproteobacteria bacterium]|nr:hypothetical protein [Gammaproteobacteria bacterium]